MQNTAMLSPAAPALLRVGGRKAVKVDARKDRSGRALQFSNWRFDCKVSAEDTAGAYCIYDTARTARGGPPMHVHHSQDEWFLVRDGEFKFVIGDETFQLKPGDTLLGPRGVPHALCKFERNKRSPHRLYPRRRDRNAV